MRSAGKLDDVTVTSPVPLDHDDSPVTTAMTLWFVQRASLPDSIDPRSGEFAAARWSSSARPAEPQATLICTSRVRGKAANPTLPSRISTNRAIRLQSHTAVNVTAEPTEAKATTANRPWARRNAVW